MVTIKDRIEALYQACQRKTDTHKWCIRTYGFEDEVTQNVLRELGGMEVAFEIVSGMTLVEYRKNRNHRD